MDYFFHFLDEKRKRNVTNKRTSIRNLYEKHTMRLYSTTNSCVLIEGWLCCAEIFSFQENIRQSVSFI